MRIKILLIQLFLLGVYNLSAQGLSNSGKEFWTGYGHHQFMEPGQGNAQEMTLYFCAESAAHVIVTIHGTAYRKEYDVAANRVAASELIPKGDVLADGSSYDARLYTPPPAFGGSGSEGIFASGGIHIESNVPIVAYAHISGQKTSGATMLMPVDTWGYSYVSLNARQYTNAGRDCFSWIYIVAEHDNTRISLTPSANTRNGRPADLPFEIDLQKGEVYQLLGATINAGEGQDLTGTSVRLIGNASGECYPVAVFCGSSSTSVTCMGNAGNGDNMMQQIFPHHAWGYRYLSAPSSVDADAKDKNINVFRILVKDPATVVKKNGQRLFGLNRSFYEYQSNTADYIEADQPVLVAQYLPSQTACNYKGTGNPEMMYLSPLEQASNRVVFFRNKKESVETNYLTLVIPSAGLNALRIDGDNTFSDTYPHPNLAGYTVVVKRWAASDAQCVVQSDSAFTAVTYGLGDNVSYGYNAGTLITNVNGIGSIDNEYNTTGTTSKSTCLNTPVTFTVFMRYQPVKMVWKLSEMGGGITPATDVVDDAPAYTATAVINGSMYYKYTLPQSYLFTTAGKFDLPVYTTHPSVENCNQTEPIICRVSVDTAYKTGFDITYDNCAEEELVTFNGHDKFTNDTLVARWKWEFTGTGSADGKNATYLYKAGKYQVHLMAIAPAGCVADTVKEFTLSDKPVAPLFNVTHSEVCEGDPVFFEKILPDTEFKEWHWDFGDNSNAVYYNGNAFSKVFLVHGKYNVSLSVTDINTGCLSDPSSKAITIKAPPVIDAGPPQVVALGTVVKFAASAGSGAVNFSWTPAALLSNAATLTPEYIAIHDQLFTLTATDADGKCAATDVLSVKILSPVGVPNVFSPNGDGINDRWMIANLADYAGAVVKVFNRSGQLVYQSEGYGVPWDGKFQGRPLPAGTYYYLIHLRNGMADVTGWITILR